MKTMNLINRKCVRTCINCGEPFRNQMSHIPVFLFDDVFADFNQLCPVCKPNFDKTPYIGEYINDARSKFFETC